MGFRSKEGKDEMSFVTAIHAMLHKIPFLISLSMFFVFYSTHSPVKSFHEWGARINAALKQKTAIPEWITYVKIAN